ncbi:ATP-binding cassette domain-containing protein [Aquamicrobium sp. LC103]|uniref:ATP-binding cassette domain-containing protein n=1 Tax=Aquamicrobium sp. LC103 TaxID=1120658 RepID=UPI00063E7BD3|nr:ATP-binding cassette domain-containing protein [Aquamicrobium sp. LC103]TKT74664.1 ABC transporter ATP-binding protein [Aquamicrobium sp. LC103]
MSTLLLKVDGLRKAYSGARATVAIEDVSLTLAAGETLGLVGPSGSGKSTLARVLLRLIEPDGGRVEFAGVDLLALRGAPLRRMRKRIQMVFQDPLAAFNPRATVFDALADPLRIHGIGDRPGRPAAIMGLLERVGLPAELMHRSINAISGGQRQRVAIARAIATRPDMIVLDEAVSALDVTVRGQILDLLVELQRAEGLSYLFISHDLAVIRAVSHRIAIMDHGRIVEEGPASAVTARPRSETGRELVAAVPRFNPQGKAND